MERRNKVGRLGTALGVASLSATFGLAALTAACASGHCRQPTAPPPAGSDDRKETGRPKRRSSRGREDLAGFRGDAIT